MLPNLRLSSTTSTSIDALGADPMGMNSVAAVRSAAAVVAGNAGSFVDSVKNNNYAANNRYYASNQQTSAALTSNTSISSGWGSNLGQLNSVNQNQPVVPPAHNVPKNLADYFKATMPQIVRQNNMRTAPTMTMNAAAAGPFANQSGMRLPADHQLLASMAAASNFEVNPIGSWNLPETSNNSSNRAWNADGSSKSENIFDDGTAIWGNPSIKKTGIDWTEKEASLNPHQNNALEKRAQKSEPVISSINGTEAWGTPVSVKTNNNSQQQSNKSSNDNSGNTYGINTANEPFSWGESSSLQQQASKNDNSSPPVSSAWKGLATSADHGNSANSGKQKSLDWLANSTPSSSSMNSSRIDELNKQLEAASIFDEVNSSSSSLLKNNASSSFNSNLNLDNKSNIDLAAAANMINVIENRVPGTIGAGPSNNNTSDLKQMGANFSSNDLIEPNNRRSSVNSTNSSNINTSQSQINSSVYSGGVPPSRDLLKQMVHQIQLAVQAGHLNAHILNQPMSTPTLQLVYTLLQQIKLLQQFQEIQQRALSSKTTDITSPNNLNLQINRVRQNISLLQKAIAQQQAALTKNETIVDSNLKQQQQPAANNYSYANISKLSTNMKVPSGNNTSNIHSNNNSTIDGLRRSNIIDTLSNNSSDSQRSAQAAFESNAIIDKNLSQLNQAPMAVGNDIFSRNNDFAENQSFLNNDNQQQQSLKGNLGPSNQVASAWSAFNSSNLMGQDWARISSNASQSEQQFNSRDFSTEFDKAWQNNTSSDGKENISMVNDSNVVRPNSTSNIGRISNENTLLNNRDSSLFYDWDSNNSSDSNKRGFNPTPSTTFSSSSIGGLSLQSHPWFFTPTSSTLNNEDSIDNIIGKGNSGNGNGNGGPRESDQERGNTVKDAGDCLNFMKSNSNGVNPTNIQRSSSALYDWGELASQSGAQFNTDHAVGPKTISSPDRSGNNNSSSRPGPPPGLMSNFNSIIGSHSSSNNEISNRLLSKGDEDDARAQHQGESSSSLWSGNWFD